MTENERIIDLLSSIEQNQRAALQAQQEHLKIAQAQLERSNKTIQESIELQRTSVSRQTQITRIVVPLIFLLLGLLGYLLVKWNIF